MSMIQYARGDLRYKGSSLPIGGGRLHLGSGAGIVRLLRQGIGGFFKGTADAAVNFNMPSPQAGLPIDWEDIFDKKNPAIVTAIPNDQYSYEVEGIIQAIDISMSESSMLTYDTGLVGRYTRVKL